MSSTPHRERQLEELLRAAAGVLETLVALHTTGSMADCRNPFCRSVVDALSAISSAVPGPVEEDTPCCAPMPR